MKTFRIWLTMIAVLLCSITASANYFEVDGISYYITSEVDLTVSVMRGEIGHFVEYKGNVTIPNSVEYNGVTYSVTGIGSYAFEDCSSLTSITLPESVTSIGNYAFGDCI